MMEHVSVSLNEPLPQYYQYPETGNEVQCTIPFMVLFHFWLENQLYIFVPPFNKKVLFVQRLVVVSRLKIALQRAEVV